MPTIKRLADGLELELLARTLLGRGQTCAVVLDERFASSEHAKLTWTGTGWTIRDLGSSNGTFVNGERLGVGAPSAVEVDAQIGFGDPTPGWVILDASAPVAVGVDIESKEVVRGVGDLLVLPAADDPSLTIFPDARGSSWLVEDDGGESRPVADLAVVGTPSGRRFRLELPVVSDATPIATTAMTLENVDLHLTVSSDEERVDISVFLRGIETKLPPREHGYFLLTLARERLSWQPEVDVDEGLPITIDYFKSIR